MSLGLVCPNMYLSLILIGLNPVPTWWFSVLTTRPCCPHTSHLNTQDPSPRRMSLASISIANVEPSTVSVCAEVVEIVVCFLLITLITEFSPMVVMLLVTLRLSFLSPGQSLSLETTKRSSTGSLNFKGCLWYLMYPKSLRRANQCSLFGHCRWEDKSLIAFAQSGAICALVDVLR